MGAPRPTMWQVRLAGLSGAASIGLGAVGAHKLKDQPDKYKNIWKTSVQYHQFGSRTFGRWHWACSRHRGVLWVKLRLCLLPGFLLRCTSTKWWFRHDRRISGTGSVVSAPLQGSQTSVIQWQCAMKTGLQIAEQPACSGAAVDATSRLQFPGGGGCTEQHVECCHLDSVRLSVQGHCSKRNVALLVPTS